jgi:NTP pyrophosphatase (non-canonical NTP hydrolase)
MQKKNNNKFSDFDDYQKFCKSTAVYPKIGRSFVYPLIGLQGEVGEVSEKIKKMFRDDKGKLTEEKKIEIVKELGDVVWYISQIATEFDVKFSDVIKGNIEKLTSRQQRGKLHGSGDNR